MALRFGAGPAQAVSTRRSVRRIFPPRMSPGKMIQILSGLRRKPGRGNPFLDFSPGDRGRRSPVRCLLLLEVPAIRLAAERHCRRKSRCGGGTKVPGQLLASIRSACCPLGRGAAPAAKAPLRRGIFMPILRIFGANFPLRSGKTLLLKPSRRHSGGFARRRGGLLKPPKHGHFPGGILRRGCAIFPAAPEIGDKLWNKLPRRNRPLSSSRAS